MRTLNEWNFGVIPHKKIFSNFKFGGCFTKAGDDAVKIDIDEVFDQILMLEINSTKVSMLKDIKLNLEKDCEYELSRNYTEAYFYLCDCILMDGDESHCQCLLELFLIHQYLDFCYLSENTIENLHYSQDTFESVVKIIRENFFVYRVIGAFRECVEQYEILVKSSLWKKLYDGVKMQIMKDTAKSYRNIGDFYRALKLYYDCLTLNSEQNWLQRAELLLKIGKVYRNYLMQTELARFYVEEAYAILAKNSTNASDEVRRYVVICLDSLGQIYRDMEDYEKAQKYFTMSKNCYGGEVGRAHVHEMLLKYQDYFVSDDSGLQKDIEFLNEVIFQLENNPIDEVGSGIRSLQLGRLKYIYYLKNGDETFRNEAYRDVYRGREIAYRYNDMKKVIRSYMTEAEFLKQEKRFKEYFGISKTAISIASDSNQLVLENAIIKDVIDVSDFAPDISESTTKIELIKRRKNIYKKLIEFSRFSIDIVQNDSMISFSKDKLIVMYGIVLNDYDKILDELSIIIEILNKEIDKINQKYIAYLNTEARGFTYKSILHKFKNDLPDMATLDRLNILCHNILADQPEAEEIVKQLETFSNIITHIKESAREKLLESGYEKKWCSLDALMQTGIQNFIYYKPGYKRTIHYKNYEQDIVILTQSTLFESNISEILNNAFSYVEMVADETEIDKKFRFVIDVSVVQKRAVILKCYSVYWDNEISSKAGASIKRGLGGGQSTKKEGSQYGFYSLKLLFEDFMGGRVEILQEDKNIGINIYLPINEVTLKLQEDKNYV